MLQSLCPQVAVRARVLPRSVGLQQLRWHASSLQCLFEVPRELLYLRTHVRGKNKSLVECCHAGRRTLLQGQKWYWRLPGC
jgi:hypothetical protein